MNKSQRESFQTNKPLNEENEGSESILACTLCDKLLDTSAHLDDHMESVHAYTPPYNLNSSEKKICCEYCAKIVTTMHSLKEHIVRFHQADGISSQIASSSSHQPPSASLGIPTDLPKSPMSGTKPPPHVAL